jgi:hypothetical protein
MKSNEQPGDVQPIQIYIIHFGEPSRPRELSLTSCRQLLTNHVLQRKALSFTLGRLAGCRGPQCFNTGSWRTSSRSSSSRFGTTCDITAGIQLSSASEHTKEFLVSVPALHNAAHY